MPRDSSSLLSRVSIFILMIYMPSIGMDYLKMRKIKRVIPIFNDAFPKCEALFAFDNSSNHY
jgi:hypothetical protein